MTITSNAKLTISAIALVVSSLPAMATGNNSWKFEITPYLWAAGLDADLTVGAQTAEVDYSFSDLADDLNKTASFLGTAQYNSWVTWAQVDYLDLSKDLAKGAVTGSLDTTLTMSTFGIGYQFSGWKERQTFDVLLGVRNLSLDNELTVDGVGDFSNDKSFTDPVIIIRPSIQLSDKWRFNPTLSFGKGGDSETTYEMQPQFQHQTWENAAIRFGYRKLHYTIESDDGQNEFDGEFAGPFIGIGWTFGKRE